MVHPTPSAADLALLDPAGLFRDRLAVDRETLRQHSGDIASLRLVVHQLSGAAGTFGFAELGELAIDLDDRFADGRPVTQRHIGRLIAALDAAIARSG